MEHEGDDDTNCNWCTWNNLQRLSKRTKGGRNWRRSKVQYCLGQPEYWKESWRPEETCCHSDSHERSSVNAGEKNLQGVIILA